MESHDPARMQCMEVWGGNQPFSGGVVMAGLDAWIHSQPYANSASGGDIHYVSSCATGRITRLLVADVSGHGSAVADVAKSLRTLMRRYVNFIDQRRFVEAMNQQFSEMSASETFATAVVTTFFAPTSRLSVSNAGHPPPLYYSSKTRQWRALEQRGRSEAGVANIPLGILDITQYDQFDIRLDVGDLVMCYTDSLMESHDAAGNMLGVDGLLKIVQSLDATDAAAFTPALLEALRARSAENLAQDDVTVLLFRPNGIGQNGRFWDRFVSPLRVARAAVSAALGGKEPVPWPEFSLANLGGAAFSGLGRRGKKAE